MSGHIDLAFEFPRPHDDSAQEADEGAHKRVAILGDFSGRGSPGRAPVAAPLAHRRLVAVDLDNFDAVLARLAPEVRFAPVAAGPEVTLRISQLDDFHPDHLYQELEVFQSLRRIRKRLLDTKTFAGAVQELQRLAGMPAPPAAEAAAPAELAAADANDVFRLLGIAPAAATAAACRPTTVDALVARLVEEAVAPHVVAKADPSQPMYVAAVDDAVSTQMRQVLHHPAFQALEAAWRGLRWLISRIGSPEKVKLHLLDVTREELVADFAAAEWDLEKTSLFRLLVEQQVQMVDGQPWSLLVGHCSFGATADDLRLLAALGALASQAGGAFLAAADSSLLGCRSLAQTPNPDDWKPLDTDVARRWQALRRNPLAPWLGLALPRFMLRAPYGPRTERTEQFRFEELPNPREHEAVLWGNPVLACAYLALEGAAGGQLEIDDLPLFAYEEDGQEKLLPCAEVCLTERAFEALVDRGLMALLSFRDRDVVRLARLQSLADPPRPLAGA
jgi:type VI secretion system protein ImpC